MTNESIDRPESSRQPAAMLIWIAVLTFGGALVVTTEAWADAARMVALLIAPIVIVLAVAINFHWLPVQDESDAARGRADGELLLVGAVATMLSAVATFITVMASAPLPMVLSGTLQVGAAVGYLLSHSLEVRRCRPWEGSGA